MKQRFVFSTVFLNLVAGGNALAHSPTDEIVERVPAQQATGQKGEKLTTIELLPGYGVNLSFIPTGETVQKVWFDNPAIASLDVDGCLEGLGRECEQVGASILHLRSIKPLNIPNLLKTNSSLLTVVTNGANGRKVYLFRVVAKKAKTTSATNRTHMVEVVPEMTSTVALTPLPSVINSQRDFNQMRRGLTVALNRRLITKNSKLWNRIASFLVKVRSGEPLSTAAQTSGISMQLVTKLQSLGNTSSSDNQTVNNTSI